MIQMQHFSANAFLAVLGRISTLYRRINSSFQVSKQLKEKSKQSEQKMFFFLNVIFESHQFQCYCVTYSISLLASSAPR